MADIATESATQTEEQLRHDTERQTDERAKDKGKQVMVEPEYVDVMNLKPEDLSKPLDLKVYRKWTSKNIPDPTPTGIAFILLDRKVRHK